MIDLRRLVSGGVALAVAACSYDYSAAPSVPPRVLTSVVLSVADSALEVGQFTKATASLRDQFGEPFDVAPVTFASSAPDVAGISPDDGKILAVSQGTTTITASAEGKTSARVLIVSFPAIFINEVALLGAAETGWVELYNPTPKAVDLTGWTITNADVFSVGRCTSRVDRAAARLSGDRGTQFPQGAAGARGGTPLQSVRGAVGRVRLGARSGNELRSMSRWREWARRDDRADKGRSECVRVPLSRWRCAARPAEPTTIGVADFNE